MRRRSPVGRRISEVIGSNRGVALLMVLWVMAILMVIVLSFSFVTRTNTYATLFFKEGTEKRFIAEAAVQRGMMEILRRGLYRNKQAVMEGSEAVKIDGTRYGGTIGNDYYAFDVVDESGKINLNLLTDASGVILNNLLVNQGVSKENAAVIVDSILDWKDADDLHRLHGVESDYYMSLPNPYKAKNARFDTVEELLMVKGMTPEILYGNAKRTGIFNFITVYSKAGGINVNASPKEVLAALPDMTLEMADKITALRESAEIQSVQNLSPVVGAILPAVSPYIGVTESNIYTIRATGYRKGEQHGFTVQTTVMIEGNNKYRCIYYKSPAGGKREGENMTLTELRQ